MQFRLVPLLALSLVLSSPACARISTGQLLSYCEQLEKNWQFTGDGKVEIRGGGTDAFRCWSYIEAFYELSYLVLVEEDGTQTHPVKACPPKGVSLTQLIRMFLQYARSNPGELHWEASLAMLNLLHKNFPCSATE